MWQNLLVPIGIMVTLAVLGWLTQMLKNAQQKREAELERQRRANAPVARPTRLPEQGPKAPANDIDRYLQEIDKLRQKAGTAPAPKPTSKPAPVPPVAPKRPTLVESTAPTANPYGTAGTTAPSRTASTTKAEELPSATVVSTIPTVKPRTTGAPTAPLPVATRPGTSVTATPKRPTATSPISKQIAALLANPNSKAAAVVLAEILGEPKCRRSAG